MKFRVLSASIPALLAAMLFSQGAASAAPIYVFKEKDGVIRFTNKTPPAGVKYQVFTGRGAKVSIIGSSHYFGGRLFHDRFSEEIVRAARENAIDAALVKAVIHVESGFNPRAVSPKGAMGLMQLMPDTARLHGVKKAFDPVDNIRGGAAHLAMLLRRFQGNLIWAIAAYNAGAEAVEQYRGIPPYSETQNYVRRVLHMKSRYALKPKTT